MGLFMYQNRDVREIGMAYLSQRFVVSTVSYLHTFGLDKATDLPNTPIRFLLFRFVDSGRRICHNEQKRRITYEPDMRDGGRCTGAAWLEEAMSR